MFNVGRAAQSPTGVGGVTIANDPRTQNIDFISDPAAFFELTERNIYTPRTITPTPGSGVGIQVEFPASGIYSHSKLIFSGTLTTTLGAGTVTTAGDWPYGFLSELILGTGASTDLYRVSGLGLHVQRATRNPGFLAGNPDTIPGGVGAGQVIPTGASPINLSWDIPIAIDPVSLIGGLYSQSESLSVQARLRQAVTTDLLVAAGGAVIDSLTGTWWIEATTFEVPIVGSERPQLLIPDLSRFHGVHAHNVPFANTGDVRAPLIRRNGQLDRLWFAVTDRTPAAVTTNRYLAANEAQAAASRLDRARLEYGGTETPLDFNPAQFLQAKNVDDYQAVLPSRYLCIDLIAENAPRDVILMTGVTDLTLIPTVNAGVVLAGGAAVHIIQETLFAPS